MGRAFSPLDEALGLPSHSPYSPQVLGWLARLGATLPFAQAAALLGELTGLHVSASTVRRQTEALGATAVAETEAEVARLERAAPVPATAPERRVLGADGAMVPLVGGRWQEAKLLSIGTPEFPSGAASGATPDGNSEATPDGNSEATPDGNSEAAPEAAGMVRTPAWSYFARLADAETFGRLALAELHRRGVETAGAVAAVQDGALWLQGFVDLHRPDAVRILDWAHAVEHLRLLVETLFPAAPARCARLLERLRRQLWEEGPDRLLGVLAGWERAAPERRLRPDQPRVATQVAYFRERAAHLAYPAFRAAGWPVGSGATESGHGTVMQARLKQAGMHWADASVDPLLALRLLERNARWPSDGPALLQAHQQRCTAQRRQRQHARRQVRHPVAPTPPPSCRSGAPLPRPPAVPAVPAVPAARPPSPTRPTRHPWRRYGLPLSRKI